MAIQKSCKDYNKAINDGRQGKRDPIWALVTLARHMSHMCDAARMNKFS